MYVNFEDAPVSLLRERGMPRLTTRDPETILQLPGVASASTISSSQISTDPLLGPSTHNCDTGHHLYQMHTQRNSTDSRTSSSSVPGSSTLECRTPLEAGPPSFSASLSKNVTTITSSGFCFSTQNHLWLSEYRDR